MEIEYKEGINKSRLARYYKRFIDLELVNIFEYLGFKDTDQLEISLKPGESDIDRGFIIHSKEQDMDYRLNIIMKNSVGDLTLNLVKQPAKELEHFIIKYKKIYSKSGYDWWNK